MKIESIRAILKSEVLRSAWSKGVNQYALEMLDKAEERGYTELTPATTKDAFFDNVTIVESSYGGDWLITNEDIAKRMCTKSELKATRNGQTRPNRRETWLDVQYRALFQADAHIYSIIRRYE